MDGNDRSAGPTLEDEIVQRSVVEILNAVYETDFLEFSFHPGRSPHQALDALAVGMEKRRVNRRPMNAHPRAFSRKDSDTVCHQLLIALLVAVVSAAPSRAEAMAARAGGGLAAAGGGGGWAALVALEVHGRTIIVRGEGRALDVPGKAEMVFAGLALGLAPSRAADSMHPYILGNLARGVDVREADWATSAGLAAGLDYPRSRLGLFVEARYDYLFQDRTSTRHHDLPRNHGSLLVGLRFGR